MKKVQNSRPTCTLQTEKLTQDALAFFLFFFFPSGIVVSREKGALDRV
jgi:hypothetical protein